MIKSICRILIIFTLLFSSILIHAQSVSIIKTDFYRKGPLGLEQCESYLASDSSFLLEIEWANPEPSHTVTAVWYITTEDGKQNQKIDSTLFIIKEKPKNFTIGFTRNSYAFLPAFYFVKIYIDGKLHKKIDFRVYPEEVLAGQFFVIAENKGLPVSTLKTGDTSIVIRVFIEKELIPDNTEIETAWFFELEGDGPIFWHEDKKQVLGETPFIDFSLPPRGYWAEGYLFVEVWIDKQFKKFFRIQIKD